MSEQIEQGSEVFVFLVNEEKDEYSRYMLPGSAANIEDDYKTFYDQAKSYTVVVIRAEGLKKQIQEALIRLEDNHFDAVKVKNYYRNPYDESVAKEVDDEIKEMHNAFEKFISNVAPLRDEPKNVTFFIHWGGGDVDSIKYNEEAATRFLRLYDGRSTWSVYSLSSLRKTIFDVTSSKIKVPDLAGLHRLKLRLAMTGSEVFDLLQVACGILADEGRQEDEAIEAAHAVLTEAYKNKIVGIIDELLSDDGQEGSFKAQLRNDIIDFPFVEIPDLACKRESFNRLGAAVARLMKGVY